MKKFLLFLFVLIALIYFTDCNKEMSVENSNTTVVTPPHSVDSLYYVDSLVLYDYDVSGNITDSLFYKYQYDSRKRLVLISETDPGGSTWDYITLNYNGTDTLPYMFREIDSSFSFSGAAYDTLFRYFTYNSQGKKIKDSSVEFLYLYTAPYYTVRNYTYSGNTVTSSGWEGQNSNPALATALNLDTAIIISNGDIISAISYQSVSGNPYQKYFDTHLTYDTKKTPEYASSWKNIGYKVPSYEYIYNEHTPFNNVVHTYQYNYLTSSILFDDYVLNITYNNQDLPVTAYYSSTPNNLGIYSKAVFKYKRM